MSLITSCPACGTMFRVVPDQLRISDGWVRCGHCAEIFDATANMAEHLAHATRDEGPVTQPAELPTQPPEWDLPDFGAAPSAAQLASSPSPAGAVRAPPASTFPPWPGPPRSDADALRLEPRATPAPAPIASTPVPRAAAPQSAPAARSFTPGPLATPAPAANHDAQPLVRDLRSVDGAPSEPSAGMRAAELDAAWSPPHVVPARDVPVPESRPAELRPSAPVPAREAPLEEVSFVRQARRKAFWRRPSVRLFLVLLGFVLAAALLLQLAYDERNRLAATQPQLRPLLERMCEMLRCQVGPPRQIEAIVIENSAFSRVRGDSYRLSFTLRNTAAYEVAVPAMELTLTDTQDQAVLRRVLTPAELGARQPPTLDAAAEWSATVGLVVNAPSGVRVAGYRLLAFYP